MSDTSYGSSLAQPWQAATTGPQDVVIQLQGIVQQLSNLVAATKLANALTFGTFTMTAGASTIVAQPAAQSNSVISINPTNAAAATLVRVNGVFISAIVSGTSFTVSTDTGSATGTETFNYLINTPS